MFDVKGRHMGGTGSDDLFLSVVRWAPILFAIAGVLVVIWYSRQRLPDELQPDVLAALSETEALSPESIRQRPPLDYQDVDLRTLETVLEYLCRSGRAVRWFEPVKGAANDDGAAPQRQVVYRRIRSAPERAG
jgi:hypothetical protein